MLSEEQDLPVNKHQVHQAKGTSLQHDQLGLWPANRSHITLIPDIHMPWNKDGVSPVHVEAQELCCGEQQACLIVSKSVGHKVGNVPVG